MKTSPRHPRRKAILITCLAGTLTVLITILIAWLNWSQLVAWYEFRRDFEGLGKNEQGYTEYRHKQSGIVMVLIPGGTFKMGSLLFLEGLFAYELPQHEVTLDSFLIAKYEVSQEVWEKVMGNNPSHFKGSALPVEMISWDECQEFCKKLGLRLPTEAQWEYACRAKTKTPYSFGETIATHQANFNGERPNGDAAKGLNLKKTVDVDSFEPNGFGLHNMHGNVFEWCEDVWDDGFYKKSEATKKNPLASSGSSLRVVRGGSWYSDAGRCRSAFRDLIIPSYRISVLSFRPAMPLP